MDSNILDLYRILSPAFVEKGSSNLSLKQDLLDSLIKDNLDQFFNIENVYRGLSFKEVIFNTFTVGSVINFGRVTSFSEDINLAKSYAEFEYETNIIMTLNCKNSKAFPYSTFFSDVLHDMIESYNCKKLKIDELDFKHIGYLEDQIEMLKEEKEWMLNSDTEYVVEEIVYNKHHTIKEIKVRLK